MSYRKKYVFGFIMFCVLFCVLLYILGFFNIGLLSDDYLNFYDATHTNFSEKLTGSLPFTNPGHFRPVYYTSLQISSHLHNLFGFSYDNFIFYRIQNLLVYLVLTFLAGWIILFKTKSYIYALSASVLIALFPNNIHNICWVAGRVDLLCGLFYLFAVYFFFLYLSKKSILKGFTSVLFFILALMTKETAVTLPFVLLLILLFQKKTKNLKEYLNIFIFYFGVLLCYLLYRLIFLNQEYARFYDSNIISVIFKSLISLSLPPDYLTLKMELLEGNLIMLLYIIMFSSLIITYLIYCIKNDFYKPAVFLSLLLIILLLPYIYIGYIRPQIILIPFTVMMIFILITLHELNQRKKKIPLKFPLVAAFLVLQFWINYSWVTVKDWQAGYNNSLARMQQLLNTDWDLNKQIIIIGNAGRYKQSFMFDKLTGAYNYWKYKEFTVKDTINDIVQTAALDELSLNSKLNYKILQPGEFEISTTGKTQFFYMEGFDSDKSKWRFSNKDMEVEAVENKFLNKPTKIRLKILSIDANCYLASEMNYFKIY